MLDMTTCDGRTGATAGGSGDVARSLYEAALACVERAELRRAQTKLRLALAHDPYLEDARRALVRIVP